MDQRVIASAAFGIHLIIGGLFALAYSIVEPTFTEGQGEFLLGVGYLAPVVSLGLLWGKNYRFGAPFLAVSGIATCWFVSYLFLIHDNPASVMAVTGEGATAYGAAVIALMISSFGIALIGLWIWYHNNDVFKSLVDRVISPRGRET